MLKLVKTVVPRFSVSVLVDPLRFSIRPANSMSPAVVVVIVVFAPVVTVSSGQPLSAITAVGSFNCVFITSSVTIIRHRAPAVLGVGCAKLRTINMRS